MDRELSRRNALRHLAVISAAAFVPAALVACSRSTSCLDVTGLSSDEVTQRNVTAAYVDATPDPAKACNRCAQFMPGAGQGCGSCKIVKGPINPNGGCKLFVAKPA